MSYCVNPDCPTPQNPETNKICQECGWNLCLQKRYRAIKLIGQGGFGRTFLAIDEGQSPSLPCLLKQLRTTNLIPNASIQAMVALHSPQEFSKSTAFSITLFQQEARRLEELGKHPQIPTLLAYFEDNQCLYFVQEFIDGTNLAKIVEEEGIFSEAQIWQLLDDLLPVLKFIHDHHIIHRDIKPENILRRSSFLTNEEVKGGEELVLVDFGAAKQVTSIDFLQTGTCIGSPEYVAPEQARGKAVFASDLYSLGVTCVYLLTGIPPFDLFDVVNDCWVWRDYLTQDVSDRLAQILDKLLENALTRRFQSVDQVMQAIAQARARMDEGETVKFPRSDRQNPVGIKPAVHLSPPSTSWQCLLTLTGNSAINSVAISPDGKLLASGGEDKTIRLWDLERKQLISTLTGHTQAVKSVAWSPDGTLLATGSDDQTVKLWDLSNDQNIGTLFGHAHAVKSVAFSPDSQVLDQIQINNPLLETNHRGTEFAEHRAGGNQEIKAVIDVDWVLASGSWDKTIKLWDVRTDREERTFKGHTLQVTSVAFSPCGKVLGSASCDRTVRLWDLTSGTSTPLYGHSWGVFAIAFSPDGKTLATGSDDNTIILWDWQAAKALYTLSGHSWSVVALAFSPDGETLISGSWDKTIKLWQVSTGRETATLTGHLDSVSSVAMNANGQMIVSASKDKTIKLWHQMG